MSELNLRKIREQHHLTLNGLRHHLIYLGYSIESIDRMIQKEFEIPVRKNKHLKYPIDPDFDPEGEEESETDLIKKYHIK